MLAAGAASRFGGGKLCAPFGGRPLIAWAVAAALAAPVERVTIVVGAGAEDVRSALYGFDTPRLGILECADWQNGLSASLRRGVASLPPNAKWLLIFLGDMPLVPADLAIRSLEAVQAGAPAALPVLGGRPAHPVAVGRSAFPILARMSGDRGARSALEKIKGAVFIPTGDPGAIADVDTVQDLLTLTIGDPRSDTLD